METSTEMKTCIIAGSGTCETSVKVENREILQN